ncbi:MAG: hypothetical protein IBX62_01930 [Coriobacteriia bacterium]|nr:hypothetical protein [Coriobacteriia bacterium]
MITAELLRFSSREVGELLHDVGHRDIEEHLVNELLEFTKGQPALLVLCIPYVLCLQSTGELKQQQEWRFSSVASHLRWLANCQLERDDRIVLYAAALLGKGSIGQLCKITNLADRVRLKRIAEVVPLVTLASDSTYSMHSLAQDAFMSVEFVLLTLDEQHHLIKSVLRELLVEGRYVRLLAILRFCPDPYERCAMLSEYGDVLFARGLLTGMRDCLEQLPPAVLLSSPHAIYLLAQILQEQGWNEEAQSKAAVAKSLAEAGENDALVGEITLYMAMSWMDSGRLLQAVEAFSAFLQRPDSTVPTEVRVLVLSLHAVCAALIGQRVASEVSLARIQELSMRGDATLADDIVARVHLSRGLISALADGFWSEASKEWTRALESPRIAEALRLSIMGNLGCSYCEVGRLRCAESVISDVLARSRELGFVGHYNCFLADKGMVAAARCEYEQAISYVRESIRECEMAGGDSYGHQGRLYLVAILRAMGETEDAVLECDLLLQKLASHPNVVFRNSAFLETAASLAVCGEYESARKLVDRLTDEVGESIGLLQRLKAELILAVCESVKSGKDIRINGYGKLSEYVESGSANWQLTMYLRAFPGLVEALADSCGGLHALPIGLLRMLALDGCSVVGRRVRQHLDARKCTHAFLASTGFHPRRVCIISVLGACEVVTPQGPVPARAWRKRKARVLFAMLVVKRGQDVPRDQILEHLWRDMDEVRARNNFYVVWSAMKSALMGVVSRSEPCPYVESIGGVCRVVRENLHTDLDDFDEQLEQARVAEGSGRPSEAIAAYEALMGIYRGDLLPGDLYDDWFSSAREHYRQEFTDAMLRGAALHEQHGMPDQALRMVRAALAFNSWREDLYRAAIRYQMATGQRGAAIETYVACRTKLSEDLGLDPSAETRRLYEDILAMEEASDNAFA